MFDLLDDAAMRTRAQLAADAHIAHLRTLSRKRPYLPTVGRRVLRRVAGAVLLALAFAVEVVAPTAVVVGAAAAVSCVSEDSAQARIGTDLAGCVWWAGWQGNGRGHTVWNRPGQ